jgi:hypothetical protein
MASTYTPIATYTVSGTSTSTYTFSSIPATYTDLILIGNLGTSANANIYLRFNSDTGTNYSDTEIYGTGSAAASDRSTNQTYVYTGYNASTDRLMIKVDVMNYSNTTTYKTALIRNGGSADNVRARVDLWRSTSAINSLTVFPSSGNFADGSVFTIYGIKSA